MVTSYGVISYNPKREQLAQQKVVHGWLGYQIAWMAALQEFKQKIKGVGAGRRQGTRREIPGEWRED